MSQLLCLSIVFNPVPKFIHFQAGEVQFLVHISFAAISHAINFIWGKEKIFSLNWSVKKLRMHLSFIFGFFIGLLFIGRWEKRFDGGFGWRSNGMQKMFHLDSSFGYLLENKRTHTSSTFSFRKSCLSFQISEINSIWAAFRQYQ